MRFALLVGILVVPTLAWGQVQLPKGEAEVNRASAMIVRGDHAGAEPLLRSAVVDAPNDPYAHFNLATVLRNTGRNQAAIGEYRRAKELFETVGPRANGEGDIANCLYGIALAEEAQDNAQAAVRAWGDYIHFAKQFPTEAPDVAIARVHVIEDEQLALAKMGSPFVGPKEASRPSTTR